MMKNIQSLLLILFSFHLSFSSAQVTTRTTIFPSAQITVHAGAMSVWGDVINGANGAQTGRLTIRDGAQIIFYGNNWTNFNAGSIEGDSLLLGEVDFIGPRPAPYAGSFPQFIFGDGEANSFSSIKISNAQNVLLGGTTAAKVRGRLSFAVDNGHILSGGLDLIIGDGPTAPGSIAGYNAQRYFVTNVPAVGHLVRNGFNSVAAQVFPVGAGENDYTPASVLPGAGVTRVAVNVSDYSRSASNETILLSNGINRTWNIYGNIAGNAQITLQHNTNTNNSGGGGPLTYSDQNGFIVYNQTVNIWANYVNPPPTFAVGNLQDGNAPIPGSSMHTITYPIANSNFVAAAHFTKDFSGAILPASGLTFTGRLSNKLVGLNWRVLNEYNLSHYDITRSTDGLQFINIGKQTAANNGSAVYNFNDDVRSIVADKLYYRLRMTDKDGSIKFSPIVLINLKKEGAITVYPNPADAYLSVSISVPSDGKAELILYNAVGHAVKSQVTNLQAGVQTIQVKDLEALPSGQYQLFMKLPNGQTIKQKVLIMH